MKKQLLNESDIRKMMKFANIGALTDGFVTRLNETYMEGEDDLMEQEEEEEELGPEGAEGEMPPAEDPELGAEEDPMADDDMGDMDPALDVPEEDPAPAAGADAAIDGVTTLFTGLESTFKAMEQAGGEAGEIAKQVLDRISMTKTSGEELPMPADDAAADVATLPDADADDDLEAADADMLDDEKVVAEVTRRVARRLVRMKARRNNS